jgi:hypothetical protein
VREHSKILAEALDCEETAIADKLFPIHKGFTEQDRITNMVKLFNAMKMVENENNQDWYEEQAGEDI